MIKSAVVFVLMACGMAGAKEYDHEEVMKIMSNVQKRQAAEESAKDEKYDQWFSTKNVEMNEYWHKGTDTPTVIIGSMTWTLESFVENGEFCKWRGRHFLYDAQHSCSGNDYVEQPYRLYEGCVLCDKCFKNGKEIKKP